MGGKIPHPLVIPYASSSIYIFTEVLLTTTKINGNKNRNFPSEQACHFSHRPKSWM